MLEAQLAALKAESDQEIQRLRTKCSQEKTCETWLGKPQAAKVTAQMLTEQIQARRAVRAGKAKPLAANW